MIKEIILMRHGQPNLAHADKVSALDMKCWIEKYELSEIVDQPAPEVSAELAKAASVIVASNAPRALTSVRALGVQPTLVDELFCEADFPMGRGSGHDFCRSLGRSFSASFGYADSRGRQSRSSKLRDGSKPQLSNCSLSRMRAPSS